MSVDASEARPSQGSEEPEITERIDGQAERLHISIGAVCNNNCIFCMEEDRDARYVNNSAMTAERVRWVLEQHRGAEEVCFTSGEPTTREELPTFIEWARSLGYARVSVMTNGRRMQHLPYAAALAKRGLNRIYISIHGHTKALHEGLTRTPGSFEQTSGGLESAARLARFGVELHTSTVLTKRNLPHLLEIYRYLRGKGVQQVVFNVMQANGRADTFFERIFPTYTETAERFAAFVRATGEDRPPAFLVDIPLCTTEAVPDFNRGYVERYRHFDLESEVTLPGLADADRRAKGAGRGLLLVTRSDLDQAERLKRAECAECRYGAQCEGVWRGYLDRNGWQEMRPVSRDESASVPPRGA